MRRFIGPFAVLAVFQLSAAIHGVRADIFQLRSGGHIEGDLVNADQSPRKTYVISVPNGGQITLEAVVVERVQSPKPEVAAYEKMRRQSPDTVEGQMKLAEWCRDQGLVAKRKTALDRVLVLDPEQPEARRLLGYRRVKDQWMTLEEEQADKGYVKRIVNGHVTWVTPQQAENSESTERQIAVEAVWRRNIGTWRKRLESNRAELSAIAKKNLQEIHDPDAIVPLSERLNGAKRMNVNKDPLSDVRLIYVEVLGRYNTQKARGPLAIAAIDDPVDEVRLSCLDELEKQKDDTVTKYFLLRLADKHATDETIERAGVGLGKMKDPGSVPALIEHVYYKRTEVIPSGGGGPGSMTSTFNKNGGGGGGLSMNQQPKTVDRWIQSRGILDALVTITGQNFGYDVRAWATWYHNQIAAGAPIAKKE